MTTQFNPLTESQIKALDTYQKLSDKEKFDILTAVQNLESIRISREDTPSENEIFEQLSATGYLEIGLACYVAQLKKIKWA